MQSRGDESVEPLRFADDDDDAEIGGFTRGKRSYDEDEDEDGGWALNEDHSARLWDSADDVDDEDSDEEGATVSEPDADDEEEEADLFGASPIRGRRGRPKGSGKKQEQPSVFSDAADIFSDHPAAPQAASPAMRSSPAVAPVKPGPTRAAAQKAAKPAKAPKPPVSKSKPPAKKPVAKKGAKKKVAPKKVAPKKAATKKKTAPKSKTPVKKRKSAPPKKGAKKGGRRR